MGQCATLIDSHCHFDFPEFDLSRQRIASECQQNGIRGLIIPGTDPSQWRRAKTLLEQPLPLSLWLAVGLHPWWVDEVDCTPSQFKTLLMDAATKGPVVAVGECGLDGLRKDISVDRQLAFFDLHLEVAEALNLPLILHGVKAHHLVLARLAAFKPPAGGVIHGFSGSFELAMQYWRLGFRVGIGGLVTQSAARKSLDAFARMPDDSLILETDAPDMAPKGVAPKQNSPIYLPRILAALADLRGQGRDHLAAVTTANVRRLFRLADQDEGR